MQYILWFLQLLSIYAIIIVLFTQWNKEGLLIWTVLSVVFANLQVVKLVSLFGLDATLGNTLYVSSFFATDAISEFYGKKEAQKAMHVSLLTLLLYICFGQFAVGFTPLAYDTTGHHALKTLFTFSPRIVLASFLCYWFSQTLDIAVYHKMTIRNHPLWKKNLWSTILSQLLDSFLFVFIAFWGVFDGSLMMQLPIIIQIGLSTYLIKTLVNILDIPFLYGLRAIHKTQILRNTHE